MGCGVSKPALTGRSSATSAARPPSAAYPSPSATPSGSGTRRSQQRTTGGHSRASHQSSQPRRSNVPTASVRPPGGSRGSSESGEDALAQQPGDVAMTAQTQPPVHSNRPVLHPLDVSTAQHASTSRPSELGTKRHRTPTSAAPRALGYL